MIISFGAAPLKAAGIAGFLFTCFGFGLLLYVTGRWWMQGNAGLGFPFLASIIAIFSGIQLFALGIVGEYLIRMHFHAMDRPSYTVHATTDSLAAEQPEAKRPMYAGHI